MRAIIIICIYFLRLIIFCGEDPTNLIPNGYFSKCYTRPNGTDQFQLIKQWYNPTKGSPDFLSGFGQGRAKLPGPVTKFKIAAKVGANCAGLINYKKTGMFSGNGKYGYREYIAVGLKKPLIKGQKYNLEFKLCLNLTSAYYCPDLDILISKKQVIEDSYVGPMNHIIPNIHVPEIKNIKAEKWYDIKIEYIAKGGERFLTIGNFKRNKDSKLIEVGTIDSIHFYNNASYFLLDDFQLRKEERIEDYQKAAKIDEIRFKQNKYISNASDSLQMLYNFAKLALLKDSSVKFNLAAYSDLQGSLQSNQKICNNRAVFIANFLQQKGISSEKIKVHYKPKIGIGPEARKVKIAIIKN